MYIISKLMGTVGQPPALVLIVLIVLLKSSRPKLRVFLFPFILVFYLLSISFGANLILQPLESFHISEPDYPSELIVVLGGGSSTVHDGNQLVSELSAESRSRVLEAVIQHRASELPVLFCGGSIDEGRSNEADAAKELLQNAGVPESMIILERESRSTRENARYAAGATELRDITLVTSAFHMRRAAACFEHEGFRLSSVSKSAPRREEGKPGISDFLPSTGSLSNSSLALHEYGGLIWYKLLNRI